LQDHRSPITHLSPFRFFPISKLMNTEAYEDSPDLLRFHADDSHLVSDLMSIIRTLPQRRDVNARTISELGLILFAMQRLPMTTFGIAATLTLQRNLGLSFDWLSLTIDDEKFILQKGVYEYDPQVGSDTNSENILEITDRVRWASTWETSEFLETFANYARDPSCEVITEIHDDEPFTDWDLPIDPDAWDRL